MMLHVDAKSSVPLTHTPTTGTGVQPYANYALTGAADFVGEGMTAFVTDSTGGSNEKIDTIINVILFQVLLAGLGEQVLILVMDCYKTNRNGFIAMALAQFLVDHGLFKVVVVVFLQRYHSKQIADRKFGNIERAYLDAIIFGFERLLKIIEVIIANRETAAKLRAVRVWRLLGSCHPGSCPGSCPRRRPGGVRER
mmetsp:Transcript_22572/g.50931  ORF Transcript_22572/g.50931 Transcript_22572/m.50931 type:complete len:196 (+) Transcript_22572:1017-1604(+)